MLIVETSRQLGCVGLQMFPMNYPKLISHDYIDAVIIIALEIQAQGLVI